MAFTFTEQEEMFDALLPYIKANKRYDVLDAGSGATSLNIITRKFRFSNIDAVCLPGDYREINAIKTKVARKNFTLIERDIRTHAGWGRYDYVFAHMLLSEASKSENGSMPLLKNLASINGGHLVIIDDPGAPEVDFNHIIECCLGAGYQTAGEHVVSKDRKQNIGKSQYAGRSIRGVLFRHKSVRVR